MSHGSWEDHEEVSQSRTQHLKAVESRSSHGEDPDFTVPDMDKDLRNGPNPIADSESP